MRFERIGSTQAATYEVPQLAGVTYRFEVDASGRVSAEVDALHARYFLSHPELFRAVGEDGKPLRAKRILGERPEAPREVVNPAPEPRRGQVGDKVDLLIAATPVDQLKNTDLVEWAKRRGIAWRNKRSILDYAERKARVAMTPNANDSVFQLLRPLIRAERELSQPTTTRG